MLKRQVEANLPTEWGNFKIAAYSENENEKMPHILMISENTDFSKPINIRIHSECMTGDVFHSKRCECGEQLDFAMKYFNENGGILFYLRKEGRGIGLINKLKAYNLQDKGFDTAEANIELGFPADGRNFEFILNILKDLNIEQVNLLTNNPKKLDIFSNSFVQLVNRIPIQMDTTKENDKYLQTKKETFGHLLNLKKRPI